MKRIAIDMDDVLADTTSGILTETNLRLGTNFTREDISNLKAKEFYEQYFLFVTFCMKKVFS
jgi:5'(3')-deoxyribonucleotidase